MNIRNTPLPYACPNTATDRRPDMALLRFLVLVTGLFLVLAAAAGAAPRTNADTARTDAEFLTQALVGLGAAYRHAAPQARDRALTDLLAIAKARRDRLKELMESDPGSVLRVAVPPHIRNAMPKKVRELLEQALELDGRLAVIYTDYPDGSARLRHYLDVYGEHTVLHFAGEPSSLRSGTPVSASGVLLDDAMALESGENIVKLALEDSSTAATSATSSTSDSSALPHTFGEQRTLVLLVNFASNPSEPWTVQEAHESVFNRASDFFWENSYGQTWLSGDVFGWFTIPVDPAGCPTMDIALAARQAAGAQGIHVSDYDRFVYAFPDIGCSWSAEATVGGWPSEAWFDGTLVSAATVSHELGHNFGLMHSHALACGDQPLLSDSCVAVEYGDMLDRMGSTSGGHFNAFQKERLGWLGFEGSPPIATADSSGVYQLDPYAAQTNTPKALRIFRDLDPATGQPRWYYLESRQAIGFDGFLSDSRYGESAISGLAFLLGTEGMANSSFRIDMTPGSQYYDWDDLALAEGASFTDTASGVTITANWVDQTGASVSVDFDQPQCVPQIPTVAVSPSQGPWVPPGTPVYYELTVTNNDSAACTRATFDLTAALPTGWVVGFDSATLAMLPGEGATTTLTVTSAAAAADGYYDVGVTATSGNQIANEGSGTATYVIAAAAGNEQPTAVDDDASTGQNVGITIDVLANDSDPDGDLLTITAVTQPSRGSVAVGSGGSVIYFPAKKFKGTETFSYTVSDGQLSASATVSVTVSGGGGGKGGGGKGGGKGTK